MSPGGLGMSEAEIGTQMAIRSVSQIVLIMGYNQVIGKVNTLAVYKVRSMPNYPGRVTNPPRKFSMALWPVVVLCFPFLNWVLRTQPGGTEGATFVVSQLGFYVIWSIW